MPREIDSLSPRKGRPAVHNFDQWLDGTPRAFVEGEDFTCLPKSFDAQFRAAAKAAGMKVSVRHPEPGIVEVEAFLPEPDAPDTTEWPAE